MPFAHVQVRAGSTTPASAKDSIPANGSWLHRAGDDERMLRSASGELGYTHTNASAVDGSEMVRPASITASRTTSSSAGAIATRTSLIAQQANALDPRERVAGPSGHVRQQAERRTLFARVSPVPRFA